jgi:hypothetical protein
VEKTIYRQRVLPLWISRKTGIMKCARCHEEILIKNQKKRKYQLCEWCRQYLYSKKGDLLKDYLIKNQKKN